MDNGLLEKGILYHEQGRYRESLKCFEEAALSSEHKSNPLVFYMLGICLREDWSNEENTEEDAAVKKESNLATAHPNKCKWFPLAFALKPKSKHASGLNSNSRKIRKQNMSRAIACFQRSLDLLMNILTKFDEANGNDTLSRLRASIASFKRSELSKDGRWLEQREVEPITSRFGSQNEGSPRRSNSIQLAVDLQKSSSSENETAACAKLLAPLPVLELGYCNFYGWGLPKNGQRALYYFTIAALLGDKDAQYQLGFMYERGLSVKRDFVKSSKYYRMYVDKKMKTQEFDLSWIYEPKFAKLPIESENEAFSIAMKLLRQCPPPESMPFCMWWPFRPKR